MAMNRNKILFTFVLIASSYLILGGKSEIDIEASNTDVLRAQFLDLENELSNTIDNGVDQTSVSRHIFFEFGKFIESNLTEEFIGNNYMFMEQVYEWKLLENDLIAMNNLFSQFRLLLKKQFDSINKLEFTDFAETVTMDKQWSVNDTFDKIFNIMIKQGFYYKVMLVRVYFLFQFFFIIFY